MIDFLYPKFEEPTHSLKKSSGVSEKYPSYTSYDSQQDYEITDGALVVLIRENLGYNNEWSYVRVIDKNLSSAAYYNKNLFVLSKNLVNIGSKESYLASKQEFLQIDDGAEEINPLFKEIFIPYVDSKNGLFSVRIQIDYERIIDVKLFNRVLEEVYLEGVNILLASRGFKSDNDTINNLKNKYYCFAYINKDLDLTVRRPCEPLTFTVSIPLNFFNNDQVLEQPKILKQASQHIIFSNNNFLTNIELLISIISSRAPDIVKITYPDKVIENFLIDFEINSLRAFAVAANELMSFANSSITQDKLNTTQYDIGLDSNLNLVSVNIKKYNDKGELAEELDFTEGLLAQCRLRGEFNNKRIFNYLLKINNMVDELNTVETIEYLTKYVKYPDIKLADETVILDDIQIPQEDVKTFRMNFSKESESCINLSDTLVAVDAGTRTAQLSDSVYHLFAPRDPKNDVSFRGIQESLSNNLSYMKENQKNKDSASGSFVNIVTGIGDQTAGYFKEQYQLNLNTLGYVVKRLDLQEILFKKIFCYLKGTDPNARETSELLSQIPYEIVNYLKYLQGIQSLKGAEYIRALEEGVSFDMQLMCSDEVTYFVKGLTKILNTVNTVLSRTVSYTTELDRTLKSISGRRVTNPYEAIITSVAKTLYTTLTDFTFEYLRDCLLTECDEPILEGDLDNFFDPFSTHYPIDRFNGSENSNQDVLKKNRLKALEETLPDTVKTLTFGSDIEYTVDLIGLLLKDINCILTATESVALLRGSPSAEVVILIKNIIRNKYSKDPNNLSYLLNDDKLKLFFAKLGLKVDPEYIEKYVDPVLELVKTKSADICTPEQYKVRESILKNKIPVELGVLADDTRRRVQKARELLEKIKNNNVVYNISALCPDVEDADLVKTKDYMFMQYMDSVKSTFTNTLTTFTEEVNKIPDKYSESRELIRKDSDGKIVGTLPYKTYNSNLCENLFYPDATDREESNIDTSIASSKDIFENDKFSVEWYKIKYRIKNKTSLEDDELTDVMLGTFTSEVANTDECSSGAGQLEIDPVFKRFVDEGRILYEARPDPRDWDSIKTSFGSRDGASNFKNELIQENEVLYNYIKQKGYVVFIDSEEQNEDSEILYDQVSFRLVYYSNNLTDFILLKEIKYSAKNGESSRSIWDYDQSLSTYTGEWISRNGWDRLSEPQIRVSDIDNPQTVLNDVVAFYRSNYPFISFYYGSPDNTDFDAFMQYTVRIIGKDFLPKPPERFYVRVNPQIDAMAGTANPVETFNVTQTIIKQLTANIIDKILVYERVITSVNAINANGLFYIENNLLSGSRSVKVASSDSSGSIIYKDFYANPIKIGSNFKSSIENVLNKTYTNDERIKLYNNGSFVFNINSMYYRFIAETLNTYNKPSYYAIEYIAYDTTEYGDGPEDYGPFIASSNNVLRAYLSDRDYSISLNPQYKDIHRENYQKISNLDYSNNPMFKNCNLYPHYLNLQYFLSGSAELYKPELCDNNLDKIPMKIFDAVMGRLTVRTYVTDQLSKTISFLSMLDIDDLNVFHMEQMIVDIMREHMRAEMQPYTRSTTILDEKSYYNIFISKCLSGVFFDEKDRNKINLNYFSANSKEENKIIDYYIRKEIRHFIKFCLENKIIIPRSRSIYKDDASLFVDKLLKFDIPKNIVDDSWYTLWGLFSSDEGVGRTGDNYGSVREYILETHKVTDYIKEEYYVMFLYILMSSTMDMQKKNLLAGTKSELARIFLSKLKEFDEEEANNPDVQTKPDEDIIKFISKLAYTNNPAALVVMNPDYSKYVSFFLESTLEETRSILLNSSMFTDPNITLTRGINFTLGTISGLMWAYMDESTRQQVMADAAVNNQALGWIYKRAESAMSPIPDAVTSLTLGAMFAGWPGQIGLYYLLFDSIRETVWTIKTLGELDALAMSVAEQQNVDPCQTTTGDSTAMTAGCSSEKKTKLLADMNKFEED